ncbi:MAG: MOSC domain-containing protein [Phycisphaerales bacterium]|nr:MOSC domain-containing protein [Phycisphaerales bacterium]
MMGTVEAIHIATEGAAPMRGVDEAYAKAGSGLVGDRYARGTGSFSSKAQPYQQATLIEAEALEAIRREYDISLEPGGSRRNITTRGIALNHLVGREFTVGEVRMRGIKLCEPCGHLEKLSGLEGIRKSLIHRGGLKAEVIGDGRIAVGDAIRSD